MTITNNKTPNNARVAPFNNLIPIINWTCYDKQQSIYRGQILPQYSTMLDRLSGTTTSTEKEVFFSRRYDRVNNDVDRMLSEYELDDQLFDIPVLLVPKDKLLFFYGQPSIIMIPTVRVSTKRRQ